MDVESYHMVNITCSQRTDYAKIAQQLENALGAPGDLHQSSPLAACQSGLEVLLATILTQATNDRNAAEAWRQLRQIFPEPQQLLEASREEVAAVIRSAGLATQKATAIRSALQGIKAQFGILSLEALKEGPAQTALDFLSALPGIGPKTAACTVLFGLGLPAFPVDTHIYRIIKRLGWIDPKTNSAAAQKLLGAAIPFHLQAPLHILLLNLGRTYCRPTNPCCAVTEPYCPLHAECPKIIEGGHAMRRGKSDPS